MRNVCQDPEEESLVDYSRRVRKLANIAYQGMGEAAVNAAAKEAFVEGLNDSDTRGYLLREDIPNFANVILRAQDLEAIQLGEGFRSRVSRSGENRVRLVRIQGSTGLPREIGSSTSQSSSAEITVFNKIDRACDRINSELKQVLDKTAVVEREMKQGFDNLNSTRPGNI